MNSSKSGPRALIIGEVQRGQKAWAGDPWAESWTKSSFEVCTMVWCPTLGLAWSHLAPCPLCISEKAPSLCFTWQVPTELPGLRLCLLLARRLENFYVSLGSPRRKPWDKDSRLIYNIIPGSREGSGEVRQEREDSPSTGCVIKPVTCVSNRSLIAQGKLWEMV